MVPHALDVAKHIIDTFASEGKPITNLKLQKLLYYGQARNLGLRNEPLFRDQIEAWVHGPVVPSVFAEYRGFRWRPITGVSLDRAPLTKKSTEHIDELISVYGDFDGPTLERMTHGEDPWKLARLGLSPDASSNNVISLESMKQSYQQ
jgi:uncharacterized phage-associated protein